MRLFRWSAVMASMPADFLPRNCSSSSSFSALAGEVPAMEDGQRPGLLVSAAALIDDLGISAFLAPQEPAVRVEHREDDPPVIEEPVVVGREVDTRGPVARQPADVL